MSPLVAEIPISLVSEAPANDGPSIPVRYYVSFFYGWDDPRLVIVHRDEKHWMEWLVGGNGWHFRGSYVQEPEERNLRSPLVPVTDPGRIRDVAETLKAEFVDRMMSRSGLLHSRPEHGSPWFTDAAYSEWIYGRCLKVLSGRFDSDGWQKGWFVAIDGSSRHFNTLELKGPGTITEDVRHLTYDEAAEAFRKELESYWDSEMSMVDPVLFPPKPVEKPLTETNGDGSDGL